MRLGQNPGTRMGGLIGLVVIGIAGAWLDSGSLSNLQPRRLVLFGAMGLAIGVAIGGYLYHHWIKNQPAE